MMVYAALEIVGFFIGRSVSTTTDKSEKVALVKKDKKKNKKSEVKDAKIVEDKDGQSVKFRGQLCEKCFNELMAPAQNTEDKNK